MEEADDENSIASDQQDKGKDSTEIHSQRNDKENGALTSSSGNSNFTFGKFPDETSKSEETKTKIQDNKRKTRRKTDQETVLFHNKTSRGTKTAAKQPLDFRTNLSTVQNATTGIKYGDTRNKGMKWEGARPKQSNPYYRNWKTRAPNEAKGVGHKTDDAFLNTTDTPHEINRQRPAKLQRENLISEEIHEEYEPMDETTLTSLATSDDIPGTIETLTCPKLGFKILLDKEDLNLQTTALIIHILSRAFNHEGTRNATLQLLMHFRHSYFLTSHLNAFCAAMLSTNQIDSGTDFNVIVSELLDIFNLLLRRLPSSADVVLGTLTVLSHCIPMLKGQGTDTKTYQEEISRLLDTCNETLSSGRQSKHVIKLSAEDTWKPPKDFRKMPIFPTSRDIINDEKPFLRSNKSVGPYMSLDHYLDVQFRLLREDFIRPLRQGIALYRHMVATRTRERNTDIRVYRSVSFLSPVLSDSGVCYKIRFDVRHFSRYSWEYSKRLIYGSLVCLSKDDFEQFIFGTVAKRELEDLAQGCIEIRLETNTNIKDISTCDKYTMVESTAYFEAYRHVLQGLKAINARFPFQPYVIYANEKVEPPLYLQDNPECTFDMSFLRKKQVAADSKEVHRVEAVDSEDEHQVEAVDSEDEHQVEAVEDEHQVEAVEDEHQVEAVEDEHQVEAVDSEDEHQVEAVEDEHQVEAVKDEHQVEAVEDEHQVEAVDSKDVDQVRALNVVRIMDRQAWPCAESLGLDGPQLYAFQLALTNELALIQGPPGTGKTFIGLLIVKALLRNVKIWNDTATDQIHRVRFNVLRPSRPILIVCYTNHALDQFLEGIINFGTAKVVRVGGRSQSESVKRFNLTELREKHNNAARVIRNQRNEVVNEILELSGLLRLCKTSLLHEGNLEQEILHKHYVGLFSLSQAAEQSASGILVWLGVDDLKQYITHNKTTNAGTTNNKSKSKSNHQKKKGPLESEIMHEQDELSYTGDTTAVSGVALRVDHFNEIVPSRNRKEYDMMSTKAEQVMNELQRVDVMQRDEEESISNIQSLSHSDRWRLYRYWHQNFKETLKIRIRNLEAEYERHTERLKQVHTDIDQRILERSGIIGMTTTGAAKHREILHNIQPRIIVVEEAAEVFESHIITTLSEGCQHLILIGDHKQLRPNPTDYELAEKYNLKISLFERLVNNGLACAELQQQHRMRPEISRIMKNIYPQLKDHDNVNTYENVKGLRNNVFFLDHKKLETDDEVNASKSNTHEAEFLAALCRYLTQQGYTKEQITVLTPYTGQLRVLKNCLQDKGCTGLRVAAVDNYQGEENDIVLVSLVRSNQENKAGFVKDENRVCVALSRAKKGLYVIGNFELLQKSSKLWRKIILTVQECNCFGKSLPIYCPNHTTDQSIKIICGADLSKHAPEGGCRKPCLYRLDCGHVCTRKCHPDDKDHSEFKCQKACTRKVCDKYSDHLCPLLCFVECDPCMIPIPKLLPQCGHEEQVGCSVEPKDHKCKRLCAKLICSDHNFVCKRKCYRECDECMTLTLKVIPKCGHEQEVPCSISPEDHECKQICKQLSCDIHNCLCNKICHVPCSKCRPLINMQKTPDRRGNRLRNVLKPLIHPKCEQPCDKCKTMTTKIMPDCKHRQQVPCWMPPEKHTCTHKCNRVVCEEHDILCDKECNMPCDKCMVLTTKIMPGCGHEQQVPCSIPATDLKCTHTCGVIICSQHKTICKNECCLPCDKCITSTEKTIPKCGHKQQMPCSTDPETVTCTSTVYNRLPCGHTVKTKCTDDLNTFPCPSKCRTLLGCGHRCSGTCDKCFQGRLHLPCAEKCGKVLICGHVCKGACSHVCPPCTLPCENRCIHQKCQHECGTSCEPCRKPCAWKCFHKKCTKMCFEPCDRTPCDKFCNKRLKCGHKCIGLCGEICPAKCRICNRNDIASVRFGYENKKNARFIQLIECGHVFEVSGLDQWIKRDQNSIKLKSCPKCNTIIGGINLRYKRHFIIKHDRIEAIKYHVLILNEQSINDYCTKNIQRYKYCNYNDLPLVEELKKEREVCHLLKQAELSFKIDVITTIVVLQKETLFRKFLDYRDGITQDLHRQLDQLYQRTVQFDLNPNERHDILVELQRLFMFCKLMSIANREYFFDFESEGSFKAQEIAFSYFAVNEVFTSSKMERAEQCIRKAIALTSSYGETLSELAAEDCAVYGLSRDEWLSLDIHYSN